MSPRGGSSAAERGRAAAPVGENLQLRQPRRDQEDRAGEQQHHQHQPVIGDARSAAPRTRALRPDGRPRRASPSALPRRWRGRRHARCGRGVEVAQRALVEQRRGTGRGRAAAAAAAAARRCGGRSRGAARLERRLGAGADAWRSSGCAGCGAARAGGCATADATAPRRGRTGAGALDDARHRGGAAAGASAMRTGASIAGVSDRHLELRERHFIVERTGPRPAR